MKNYIWKSFRPEAPVACMRCNKFIFEDGSKLILTQKITLLFHKKCAEKVEQMINKGFNFIIPRPYVLLAMKVPKKFKVKKTDFDAGDALIIDHNWKLKGMPSKEFNELFTIIEREES